MQTKLQATCAIRLIGLGEVVQRIFIAFFLTITVLAGLAGIGFDFWSGTDSFRTFANSAIQSAADESGATLNLEKGRADLRVAGLLIFFTIATMAWMPLVGIIIRSRLLDEDIFDHQKSLKRFRIFSAISLGLWITMLILIL